MLAWCCAANAQTADLTGQASGWVGFRRDVTQIGARYIPELSLTQYLSDALELSGEAAVNAHGFNRYDGTHSIEHASGVDPYRLWARLASPKFEARLGLQKINFGSATLLRPLRWFDSIDPRDPLALTEGVYGVLGRYTFEDNANIWMWALHGNHDPKGWETLPTDKQNIEFGGRAQVPVRAGEMGVSYHRRRVDPQGSVFGAAYPAQGTFSEDHLGLDAKWDVGVGLWFEGTVTRQAFDVPASQYLHRLTVGTDYTFDVGNGPHALFEQFVQDRAETVFQPGAGHWVSAVSLDYPFSLLDRGVTILYYDWHMSQWSRLLQWQRAYDRWQIHVSAFWNPDQASLTQETTAINRFAGKGLHIMAVFDH
ncbi:MAG: hypothetical protein GY809_08945 [Planctomycetes bacterium]|nr:hypothetical protein [Planctomycetota bacterium]